MDAQPGIVVVDSLIRGWPFGTLLMWKSARANFRTSRTDSSGALSMVRLKMTAAPSPERSASLLPHGLGRPQRVQSLLLALGGDAWGFKREDRDWARNFRTPTARPIG